MGCWSVLQGCGPGSSSERTRTAITAALRKKLRDLMGEFQQLRQRLQDEYRCASCSGPPPTCICALPHRRGVGPSCAHGRGVRPRVEAETKLQQCATLRARRMPIHFNRELLQGGGGAAGVHSDGAAPRGGRSGAAHRDRRVGDHLPEGHPGARPRPGARPTLLQNSLACCAEDKLLRTALVLSSWRGPGANAPFKPRLADLGTFVAWWS